jgi:hypothetical protein
VNDDVLTRLRDKLAAGIPDEPAEWQCTNCIEYNRDDACWYCGKAK